MSDCSRHSKQVAGISDMKILAEAVGELHYETLSQFLVELSIKIYRDGKHDGDEGREQLADSLMEAQYKISEASGRIYRAWQISKPFMKPENNG
jgi:hypothetical protein